MTRCRKTGKPYCENDDIRTEGAYWRRAIRRWLDGWGGKGTGRWPDWWRGGHNDLPHAWLLCVAAHRLAGNHSCVHPGYIMLMQPEMQLKHTWSISEEADMSDRWCVGAAGGVKQDAAR